MGLHAHACDGHVAEDRGRHERRRHGVRHTDAAEAGGVGPRLARRHRGPPRAPTGAIPMHILCTSAAAVDRPGHRTEAAERFRASASRLERGVARRSRPVMLALLESSCFCRQQSLCLGLCLPHSVPESASQARIGASFPVPHHARSRSAHTAQHGMRSTHCSCLPVSPILWRMCVLWSARRPRDMPCRPGSSGGGRRTRSTRRRRCCATAPRPPSRDGPLWTNTHLCLDAAALQLSLHRHGGSGAPRCAVLCWRSRWQATGSWVHVCMHAGTATHSRWAVAAMHGVQVSWSGSSGRRRRCNRAADTLRRRCCAAHAVVHRLPHSPAMPFCGGSLRICCIQWPRGYAGNAECNCPAAAAPCSGRMGPRMLCAVTIRVHYKACVLTQHMQPRLGDACVHVGRVLVQALAG